LKSVAPDYPKLARLEKRGGEVLLRVRIDEEGAVRWILLEESDRRFDGAAVQAVREWRFTPALRDGQPIAVDMLIPMRFRSDR
jgi:protein TonB